MGKRAKMAEIYKELCERYPKAFFGKGSAETRPLKVHIVEDIIRKHPEFSRALVGLVVWKYTQKDRYLRALCVMKCRYDLDGWPCGEVTDEERDRAQDFLSGREKVGAVA